MVKRKKRKFKKVPKTKKGVPIKYVAGAKNPKARESEIKRTARKKAIQRLNKNNKGSGVLPGDKKGGKFVGSKKESVHNKRFRRMYG